MMKEMFVDIGNSQLFAKVLGAGEPVVVMDAGYGDTSETWKPIITEVAQFAKVVIYDRAGLGRSEKSTNLRTSQEMVKELRTLLHNLHLQPPFLFVGHSFGGINVRLYATEYPEEVAGLILIDSTPEDYRQRFLPTMTKEFQQAYNQQFVLEGNYDEFMESLGQVKKTKKKLTVPVTVLAAGKKAHYSTESQALWNNMQRELLEISTHSELVLAEKSAHYIHHDEPELVVHAIRQLVNQIISN